jgi:hypothetical protein
VNDTGISRVRCNLGHRWWTRLSIVFVATAVAFICTGGIGCAHWIATAVSGTSVGVGSLTVAVENAGTRVDFTCETHVFPHHALSFIRFWAPDQALDPLATAGTGAVKIEENSNETGDGYRIDPPRATIGDAAVIHLGASTVAITDWVPKPDEPGEYVGFLYSVEGGPVTVDAKAGNDLWRQTATGSGVWSLDGVPYDGSTALVDFCPPPEARATIDVENTGSVPAKPYLTLGGDAVSANSVAFEATVVDDAGAVLGSGLLRDLYGRPLLVADQIDPRDLDADPVRTVDAGRLPVVVLR